VKRGMVVVALSLWMSTASGQEILPSGPGQQLVLNACVQCHDLRWIVSQTKSESAWRHTVNEMIWRGAPMMPGDIDIITKYLTTMQRSQSEAPKKANRPMTDSLPAGHGRALVRAACVQCHDLGLTVSAHKTLDQWRQSVERMVHLGARLNGGEIEEVSRYLAGAFKP